MNGQKLKGMLGLLLDGGAGPNTRKRAEELCGRNGTPLRILPEGMIEEATGRDNMVLALQKGSFADKALEETQPDRTNIEWRM